MFCGNKLRKRNNGHSAIIWIVIGRWYLFWRDSCVHMFTWSCVYCSSDINHNFYRFVHFTVLIFHNCYTIYEHLLFFRFHRENCPFSATTIPDASHLFISTINIVSFVFVVKYIPVPETKETDEPIYRR